MSEELTRPAILTIMHDDLAEILTSRWCDRYGAFKNLRVVAINPNDGGGFDIGFEPTLAETPS